MDAHRPGKSLTDDRPSRALHYLTLVYEHLCHGGMTTQDLLVLAVSFCSACFALNIYKLNQPAK